MMCVDSLGGGRRGCGAAAEWEGVPLHGHPADSPLAFSSRLQVGRSRAQFLFLGQEVESFLSLGMLIIGLVLPVCLFFPREITIRRIERETLQVNPPKARAGDGV